MMGKLKLSKPSDPMPEDATHYDETHWYKNDGLKVWYAGHGWMSCHWELDNALEYICSLEDDSKVVGVGVGVLVYRNGKFLVSKRKGSHGAGCWSLPGGHLEFGESIEECARREVLEETGVVLDTVISCEMVTNDIFVEEGKHYVTLWVLARLPDTDTQVALNLEPEKCEGWEWHRWPDIPKPHFLPLANMQERFPLFDTEDGDPCVFV